MFHLGLLLCARVALFFSNNFVCVRQQFFILWSKLVTKEGIMVPDISNDRFDTWHAELGAFTCQSRKTDKQPNGPPDIAASFSPPSYTKTVSTIFFPLKKFFYNSGQEARQCTALQPKINVSLSCKMINLCPFPPAQ